MQLSNFKYYMYLYIHLFICFCLVYGWIFPNKLWLEFLILASIYIQTMYGVLGGCICTRLEIKHDKHNQTRKNTIIEPIINMIGLKNNRANTDYITGLFVNAGLITTIIVRYIIL